MFSHMLGPSYWLIAIAITVGAAAYMTGWLLSKFYDIDVGRDWNWHPPIEDIPPKESDGRSISNLM